MLKFMDVFGRWDAAELNQMEAAALLGVGERNALAAFITRKAEIDVILARLIAFSDEHFDTNPENVTWGDVGTLSSYLDGLRRVSDGAFHEGEHAA